jgi:hypothetical protein
MALFKGDPLFRVLAEHKGEDFTYFWQVALAELIVVCVSEGLPL